MRLRRPLLEHAPAALALAFFAALCVLIRPPIEVGVADRAHLWITAVVIALLAGVSTMFLSRRYAARKYWTRWMVAAALSLTALGATLTMYARVRAQYSVRVEGIHVVVGDDSDLTDDGRLYRDTFPNATREQVIRRTGGRPDRVWHAAALHRHARRMESYFLLCAGLAAVSLMSMGVVWRARSSSPAAAAPPPTSGTEPTTRRFRVALSFPGEVRDRVGAIAEELEEAIGRERVFYDVWYRGELARPNMDLYLQDIYRTQAELLVVFLCADYHRKEWCGLEWRVVRDLIKSKESERLMFLRLDDAPIEGLLSIDGYLDIVEASDSQVAAAILARMGVREEASGT